MSDIGSLFELSDFELGPLMVRPRQRILQSKSCSVAVEPLVMQLLVTLSRRAGILVSRREIFEVCWGAAAVGDESLNRVVGVLRKVLRQVAGSAVRIETVPSAGYLLKITHELHNVRDSGADKDEIDRAIVAAFDSWRLGLPEPDHVRLEGLRAATNFDASNARAWGMLALLCRHAAEYGGPAAVSTYVRECEYAARRATEIDARQPEARTALVSIVPLLGGWEEARQRLKDVLADHPDHLVATQDLATLEMATGCVRVSKDLRDSLVARDPLAATFCYKSVYQHWSVGDLAGMDHVADRALQLWPSHPAVWMVRFWTLAFTNRVPAAIAILDDRAVRPRVPEPALAFLRELLTAVVNGDAGELNRAADASVTHARTGPANAMAAMFGLGLLDQRDRLFDLTDAYYLGSGIGPIPARHTEVEPSLNEHHRRLTQVLFTPVFADMRGDPRFMRICDRIGLCRYWDEMGVAPDFLADARLRPGSISDRALN